MGVSSMTSFPLNEANALRLEESAVGEMHHGNKEEASMLVWRQRIEDHRHYDNTKPLQDIMIVLYGPYMGRTTSQGGTASTGHEG